MTASTKTLSQLDWSQLETHKHISEVRNRLLEVISQLAVRAQKHDASKLQYPEAQGFAEVTQELSGLVYGSVEYEAARERLKPILAHHYAMNTHHPEHWRNGVEDMDLLDLVEMFCDWKASSMRMADGCILQSIEKNKERFDLAPVITKIFRNTAQRLNWASQATQGTP